jgi:hypothetical protein
MLRGAGMMVTQRMKDPTEYTTVVVPDVSTDGRREKGVLVMNDHNPTVLQHFEAIAAVTVLSFLFCGLGTLVS